MAGTEEFVLDCDGDTCYIELREFPSVRYYDNGSAEADWAHNQGRAGRIWPRNFYLYDAESKGFLELDICENKTVCDTDEFGRPVKTVHEETTLSGVGRISKIAENLHHRGGKVIISINITLPWLLADVLLAGFDTYPLVMAEAVMRHFFPVGVLPLTLPAGDHVLKADENGVCISPNDVLGFYKDRYLPEKMKDENGKAYAYRDQAGNYYEHGFGLRIE